MIFSIHNGKKRALSNPQWKLLFEDAHVRHLRRTSSNQHPILLHTSPSTMHNFSPKPFRPKTMWFNDPTFPSVIHQSWSKHPRNIEAAMDVFTTCVKSWNSDSFGNIFHRKKRILARLTGIQKFLYNHNNLFLQKLETDLQIEYKHTLLLKEELWALKSRVEWTLLGDRNTNFFHL